jgi:hypothetical protein
LGLAAGADGYLWVTIPDQHLIDRMTPSGYFGAYGGGQIKPSFIAAASDGFLYFSEPNGRIGRINADGDIVEFETGE